MGCCASSPLPAAVAGSRTCDPLEGEYESFPIGGGDAVESFALTVRGDRCTTWGSKSGMNTHTMRDGVLHHHHHREITAQVDGGNRRLTWSLGSRPEYGSRPAYVSRPAAGEVPRELAPALEGIYESFHTSGEAGEKFCVTVRGNRISTWGEHTGRRDYSIEGSTLVLQGVPCRCLSWWPCFIAWCCGVLAVRGHLRHDGSFAWSHNYVGHRAPEDRFEAATPEPLTSMPAQPLTIPMVSI